MTQRTYSQETKAQIIAEWKAGASYGQMAKAHNIPRGTVQRWVGSGMERVVVAPQKIPAVYDLDEMALKLIDGSVSAVAAIHGIASDRSWLKEQNAADIAILFGVISDKLYRLLGAIRPDTSIGPPDEAGTGVHPA